MPRRKLPPNIKQRKYTTADGRKRILYNVVIHRKSHYFEIPAGDSLPIATQKRGMIVGKLAMGYDLAADPENLRGRKSSHSPTPNPAARASSS